ncbi:SWIM zinc finger family protein [Streptodolium elevatio]|uniref:SWIM zinc finger family protein n=1 Tax=Streptodolium elevatio TaxID=3157996 RepID=A0ABV3DNK1_9ACTN
MNESARGFPAFPAGRRGGRGFARSWWGKAWIQALEDAALDSEALRNGRKYACTGRVGSITVSPGHLFAPVHGEGEVHRTTLTLQPLTARQWDRFLDQVAARAGHIAALLRRDMPHDLVAAAEDVGVPLLPGMGDLDPSCDCEDWGHPCRHAAALAYQAAWLVDEDPFLLLLMRGLGEQDFLAALQLRGAEGAREGGGAGEPIRAAVAAGDAYAAQPGPLPADPELPDAPGEMPTVADGPELEFAALRLLARDAAERAFELLCAALVPAGGQGMTGEAASGDEASGDPAPLLDLADLGERADAVRLAARHDDPDAHRRLRAAHDRPADFERGVAAWRYGGPRGFEVFDSPWRPNRTELACANTEFQELWADDPEAGRAFAVSRNRWTDAGGGRQLRYGRDGRWYPYEERGGVWWPSGRPDRDAASALDHL